MVISSNGRSLYVFLLIAAYVVGLFGFIQFMNPYGQFVASPDERAAQSFTERLKNLQSFNIPSPEDIPPDVLPYLIPRSTDYVQDSGIRYASYLGLPVIFSFFGKLLPYNLIFVLTALLGTISIFGILRVLNLDFRLSLAGAAIFATLPHMLLYTARGFMHNTLFVDILALSIWLLCLGLKSHNWKFLILSGAFLGLSAGIRTNEMLWAVPLFCAVILYMAKKDWFKMLCVSGIAACCLFLPYMLISYSLTKSPVQYQVITTEVASQSESALTFAKSLIFPFGFDLSESFTTFWHFASQIWWIASALVISIVFTISHSLWKKHIARATFITILVLLGIYLIAFYGLFPQEGPKNTVLVSHSHFRYWLPIFTASALVIPYALSKIAFEKCRLWVIRALVLGFVVGSIVYLWTAKGGIQDNPYQNILAHERNKKMHTTVSQDAIILAGIADKYFFPDWVVAGTSMHGDRKNFVDKLSSSHFTRPVYYYYTPADISSSRTLNALRSVGIQAEYVATFFENEKLYRLSW